MKYKVCFDGNGLSEQTFTTDGTNSLEAWQGDGAPDLTCGANNGNDNIYTAWFQLDPADFASGANITLKPEGICVYDFKLWEYENEEDCDVIDKNDFEVKDCMFEENTNPATLCDIVPEQGKKYFLSVNNSFNNSGAFKIELSPLGNCRIGNPLRIATDTVAVGAVFSSMKGNPDPIIENEDMENNEPNYNVWFEFTTGDTGDYIISTIPIAEGNLSAISDYYIAVYDDATGTNQLTESLYESGNYESALVLNDLDSNKTYYFSVDNGGTEGRGAFRLAVNSDDGSNRLNENNNNNFATNATLVPILSYNSVQQTG